MTRRFSEVVPQGDPDCIEYNTYLLAVGSEIYVTPMGDKDPQTKTKHILKQRESYAIPPGQLALLTTAEAIKVPPDAIAFIAMRSRLKFRGLINVSGFSVDPGYNGQLIFAVYNAGPSPVHVTEGERLFTIFFADLDLRSGKDFVRSESKAHHGISSEQITAISADFLTLKGLDTKIGDNRAELDKRLQSLERENAVVRWAVALIASFLLSFAARSCSEQTMHQQGNGQSAVIRADEGAIQ